MSTNTATISKDTKEYRTRKPQYSPYDKCIEDNYETFEKVYERKYEPKYGYLRPIVSKVIYQYLDCGILAHGFARVSSFFFMQEKTFLSITLMPKEW